MNYKTLAAFITFLLLTIPLAVWFRAGSEVHNKL